jgi:hypothetical protein
MALVRVSESSSFLPADYDGSQNKIKGVFPEKLLQPVNKVKEAHARQKTYLRALETPT